VIACAGPHRTNHRQFVSHAREVRKKIGHPQAAVAALLEGKVRLVEPADLAHEPHGPFVAGDRLAVQLLQGRLVVEGIDLAQTALQENLYRTLCLGRMMRKQVGRCAGLAAASRVRRVANAMPPSPVANCASTSRREHAASKP